MEIPQPSNDSGPECMYVSLHPPASQRPRAGSLRKLPPSINVALELGTPRTVTQAELCKKRMIQRPHALVRSDSSSASHCRMNKVTFYLAATPPVSGTAADDT